MSNVSHSVATDHVSRLLRLDWNQLTVPINGFFMPIITIITLVNNLVVLTVLLRRQMRSPTNALLAALAVSDTLMSVCPMPYFIYFYTGGQRYLDWVPYSWCFAYFCLSDYLPTVFHTTSIWLTTCLAVQRYARVCCQADSKVRQWLCSMTGAVSVIVGVFVLAVASQACRLAEFTFRAVRVPSLVNSTIHHKNHSEVTACQYELTPFVARHETTYFNIYYWSRVILIHVIPCTSLVVLNTILVRIMRTARQRRRQMSESVRTVVSRQLTTANDTQPAVQYEMQALAALSKAEDTTRSNTTHHQGSCTRVAGTDSATKSTMMLIVVVGVFLLVEVPLSVRKKTLKDLLQIFESRHKSAVVRTWKDFRQSPDTEVPLSGLGRTSDRVQT